MRGIFSNPDPYSNDRKLNFDKHLKQRCLIYVYIFKKPAKKIILHFFY